jgi:hypothetical protein
MRFVNNDFQENKEPTIGGTYTATPDDINLATTHFISHQVNTNKPRNSRIPDAEMQPTNPNHQV